MLTSPQRFNVPRRYGAFAFVAAALGAGCPACEEPPVLGATYALCVAPEAIDFGEQALRTERTRIVGVTNCGNVPINGISALLTGVDGDDAGGTALQIVETTVPLPIQPGARFTLPLRFRPTEARAHSAELAVTIDAVAGVDTSIVPIVGVGAAPGECDILIGPDPVSFGPVLVDDAVDREITITNQGSGDCALSGARVTLEQSDFFEVAVPPPAIVAPGESVGATIRFSPSTPGARAGRFAVVVDGASEIVAVLDGVGVSRDACALLAEPAPITLPRAAIGLGATEASTVLTSVGELPCTIAGVVVEAATAASDFAITERPADDVVLDTGDSAVVSLAFTPTVAGPRTAALAVDTDEGTRLLVPISAFADPSPTCALLFDPGTVSFAPIGVGLAAESTVTFTNASTVTC
ncbi:MAG TPA: choice-of-anchor D domain-containing protein, partial [Myxococcota bacterium]